MSVSCRGCKCQVVILEGGGGSAVCGTDTPPSKLVTRGARSEETRGRGPMTSSATLSTDLGQRATRFIYMHVGEREDAFSCARANTRAENSPVTRFIHNSYLLRSTLNTPTFWDNDYHWMPNRNPMNCDTDYNFN